MHWQTKTQLKSVKFTDINIWDQTLLQPAVIQTCLTSSAKAYVWPHCNMTCLTDVGMKTSGLRLTLRCSHAAPTSLRLQHCHSGIFFALMQKFRSPHLAIAKDAQHVAWFGLAHNLIIICQHLATKKKPLVQKSKFIIVTTHICNNRDFLWKYHLPLEASTLSSFLYDTGSASAEPRPQTRCSQSWPRSRIRNLDATFHFLYGHRVLIARPLFDSLRIAVDRDDLRNP